MQERQKQKGKQFSPKGIEPTAFVTLRLQVQKNDTTRQTCQMFQFCVKMLYINDIHLKPITKAKVLNFLYRVSLQKTSYT